MNSAGDADVADQQDGVGKAKYCLFYSNINFNLLYLHGFNTSFSTTRDEPRRFSCSSYRIPHAASLIIYRSQKCIRILLNLTRSSSLRGLKGTAAVQPESFTETETAKVQEQKIALLQEQMAQMAAKIAKMEEQIATLLDSNGPHQNHRGHKADVHGDFHIDGNGNVHAVDGNGKKLAQVGTSTSNK